MLMVPSPSPSVTFRSTYGCGPGTCVAGVPISRRIPSGRPTPRPGVTGIVAQPPSPHTSMFFTGPFAWAVGASTSGRMLAIRMTNSRFTGTSFSHLSAGGRRISRTEREHLRELEHAEAVSSVPVPEFAGGFDQFGYVPEVVVCFGITGAEGEGDRARHVFLLEPDHRHGHGPILEDPQPLVRY